jgi:hypothetical protein
VVVSFVPKVCVASNVLTQVLIRLLSCYGWPMPNLKFLPMANGKILMINEEEGWYVEFEDLWVNPEDIPDDD